MLKDTTELVKKCKACQEHAKISHLPSKPLTLITSPWPFQQWGLDILGPLPIGRGQCKFIIVAVDYFTKWVEAEPLATITKHKVRNFVWRSIICRFGIPRSLVSDNGKQFGNPNFMYFCAELGIKNCYSSPAHPQSNRQAEVTIRTLKAALKTKLEDLKGKSGRIPPRGVMGTQNYAQVSNSRDPIRSGLWHRSSSSCRGRIKVAKD